jgi:hypothetical protein
MSTVGFCSGCGIVREDDETGTPITDCVCTALVDHKPDCLYVKCVRCPIDVGVYCSAHGLQACEQCDCDCRSNP